MFLAEGGGDTSWHYCTAPLVALHCSSTVPRGLLPRSYIVPPNQARFCIVPSNRATHHRQVRKCTQVCSLWWKPLQLRTQPVPPAKPIGQPSGIQDPPQSGVQDIQCCSRSMFRDRQRNLCPQTKTGGLIVGSLGGRCEGGSYFFGDPVFCFGGAYFLGGGSCALHNVCTAPPLFIRFVSPSLHRSERCYFACLRIPSLLPRASTRDPTACLSCIAGPPR